MHSVFNIWSGEIFSYNSRIDYQNWPSDDIVESKVLISYYESLKATFITCHQRQNTLFFGKKLAEVKISTKWGGGGGGGGEVNNLFQVTTTMITCDNV